MFSFNPFTTNLVTEQMDSIVRALHELEGMANEELEGYGESIHYFLILAAIEALHKEWINLRYGNRN